MDSNKEQVRAHNFVARRLATAAVTGQADPWEPPVRRTALGSAVGLLLAVVLVIGFLVYGLVRPGKGPTLSAGTNVVIEKETGTRYLVQDGRLRPLENMTSALLAVGPALDVQTMSRARTAALPRGAPVGVPGAPEDVASPDRMVVDRWAVCVPGAAGAAEVGAVTVTLGGVPPAPLPAQDGVFVAGPDRTAYVVSGGRRHVVRGERALALLGYEGQQPVPVPQAWLAALPPGPALAALTLPDVGSAGAAVGGAPAAVGRLVQSRGALGDVRHFVVGRGRLLPVTEVERRMLLADPRIAALDEASGGPLVVPRSATEDAARVEIPGTRGWPAAAPLSFDAPDRDLCAAWGADGPVVGTRPAGAGAAGARGVRVVVPPESGALVEASGAGGGGGGGAWLVDDLGRRFRVADGATLEALGLADAPRLRIPAPVLALVPEGVVLDVAQVRGKSAPGEA